MSKMSRFNNSNGKIYRKLPIFAREETLYRMKTLLHKALLYIAVYIICAVVLCLVLCNIAYYLIPSSHAYMKWVEAAAFIIAVIYVILFVRCRPLTPQEKKELRFFRFRLR